MQTDVIEGFRLSPQQKHLWSLQQGGRSLPYHAQCAILIEGSLDPAVLKTALQKLIDRHEILRTSFHYGPGMTVPLQTISETVMPSIADYNLSGSDLAQQETAIETLCREAGELAFDFDKGPPLRLSLITQSRHRHLLLVTLSALCADTASLNNLVRELSRSYSACLASAELSDEPLQYADAAEWQNDLLESEDTESGRKYWRERKFSTAVCPRLPFERRPCASSSFQPHCMTSPIAPDLAANIQAVLRRSNTSPSIFFLACWQTLLWRLTGQADFVIGMACDGRTYEGLQEALGLFEKTLPILCHLEERLRFDALLKRIEESVHDAIAWQEYFSWAQGSEAQTDTESRPPFLSVAFEFTQEQVKYSAAGVSFSIKKRHACSDRFALKLSCIQNGETLLTDLHYDSHSFRAEDIARIHREFQTLLQGVTDNAVAEIDEFAIVGGTDLQQLVIDFNRTGTDYPNDKCVQQLFEEQVDRTPENVAIVFDERHLTYAELNARANQLAHHLQSLGVSADVPVAICMERSLETIVGILGVLKSGGAYVPLDPEYPVERLAYMLEDVHAPILLTHKPVVNRISSQDLRVLCLDSDWASIAQNCETNPVPAATVGNLAYVIYTSGSTGQPKGVVVEHAGLGNAVNWITETLNLTISDRCLLKTPITFDAAGREIFPTLISGGTLLIAEPNGHRDCRYLAEKIRREQISILHCVPSLLRLLLEEPAFHDAHALRATMCGGEALAPEIVARFHEHCTAKLYNVYGPTEAIIDATYQLCQPRDTHSTVPIGRPIPNARVYILDRLLRPLPIGVAGNLYIGGPGLARGYLGRPDLTAERFIPDPLSGEPGARLYQTGDRARYLPDGNIEFLGRSDHQIKIRGFRIELGEIEATLGRHPAVREAVVVLQEDERREPRLVAYVTAAESRPASNDLQAFLKDKLPDHMMPAVFVLLDALPLTSNGKLDRSALSTPDGRRPESSESFVASRTPTEELLADIWSQVLAIERVGINDNFFQLGGHSLLATRVVSRIRDAFQIEMPLRRLFEAPTVSELAETIDQSRGAGLEAPPLLSVPRDGGLPLSFAQQRLWFIDRLEPGSSVYNFPAAVRLHGPLNLQALTQSLNEIVRRHEALRTTFAIVDGRPVQVIASCLVLTLPLVDLRALPEIEREAAMLEMATDEAQRPFNLAEGPLVRATVLQLRESDHVGLLTMHHIVADGWSTGILIRELAALYQSYCSGRPSPLPDLPIQYADFAHWQRRWMDGETLQTQLRYWKQQLSGAPPLLELPTDRLRPAVQTFRGARQSLLLPKAVGDGLQALSRREGVTLFMTLLAAFQILLHRYTNQDDLVVGTPIANRNRSEIEGLIGFFVNSLALRIDLSGNPGFPELLHRVREVCLGAYAHQNLPFERLVEELHRTRDLSRNPLFQVMFVLQNAPLQAVELPGMSLRPLEIDSGTTHFDLTLHIADTAQGLAATMAYNTDLFESETIVRMLGHFMDILETLVSDPEQRLSDLTPLTEAERRQIFENWNDTAADLSNDLCIQQLFEAQVERTPAALALVLEDRQMTYGELNRRSNQLANHLRTLGVGPEIAVGICLKHSLETIVGLLAVLKAGGVYVPLDPAYPPERLAFMLEDAHIPVLLTQEPLLARLPRHHAKVVCLDSGWESIASESPENPICVTSPENLAYVIYTSGSTGRPKGVSVSHRSTAEHCLNVQKHYDLTSCDKVLQFASLSFDLSLEQILPTLIVGASLVLMGTDLWQTREIHKKISEFGLTVLNLSTGYWQELAREWADRRELVPNIEPRLIIVGGDTMLPEFLDLWQRTPIASTRLINAYGPTETTITATAFDLAPGLREHLSRPRIPIGRPLANRQTYILNEYGNAVPVGIPGELYIGGTCLARGYLKRPDLTAEKFIPNPFNATPGSRMYKTGDLARYLPDGNIEFLGRIDHQVKIRGFRIELGEIEAVLRQHPAVRESIVMARSNTVGELHLVAFIVPQPDTSPTVNDLRAFLTESLPEYMMPAIFMMLDALPLMPNGKIDRNALPAPTQSETGRGFVAPRNRLERELVDLWEEVLGIRPIGVTDNFFELGGHSLAAVRLFALIEKRLGKKVPLATVFQGATVEHLANILDRSSRMIPRSSLVAIQPSGNRRPLFLIHPAGGHVFPYVHLAHYLGSDQPCYGLQARGLEEGQQPHSRIEDMATDYINAIRTVQPEGPYLLGGWSMGGVVAFEMAQQLHAQGRTMALLALLDTRIPAADEEIADEDFEARLLVDFVRYFGLSLDPRDALARLPKQELLERVLEHAKRAGLMPLDIEVSQAQPFIELCKADFRATQNYILHDYSGRITLFKAGQELGVTSADPTLGWGEWAAQGVDIHVVPGNHATMVYKPHVEVLANRLRACLDQARVNDDRLADGVNSPVRLMKDAK